MNNYQNNQNDLVSTNANISPDAAIWTLSSKQISNFFDGEFAAKIDGFQTLRAFGKKDGGQTQIACYAFIDADSRDIVRSNNGAGMDISPVFKGKLEQETSVKGNIINVFRPFAFNGDVKVVIRGGGGNGEDRDNKGRRLACVELDPFALLGYMLAVKKGNQELVITHVDIVDRRSQALSIRCCKRYRNVVSDRDFNDVYNQIYNNQLSGRSK